MAHKNLNFDPYFSVKRISSRFKAISLEIIIIRIISKLNNFELINKDLEAICKVYLL